MRKINGLLLTFCSVVATANAGTIFDVQQTASASNPAPVGSIDLGPGGAVGGIGGPVSFMMPFDGIFTIAVDDCCLVGDVYQTFVDGASLGLTSPVPLGGPTFSSATFSTYLAAGLHSYDLEDQLLSYIGYADPYGGGLVPSVYSPAGVEVVGSSTAAPEPGTCVLIGLALIFGSIVGRRRAARG